MNKNYNWRQLADQLDAKRRIIFLGEVHGAQVNPKIIDIFVRRLGVKLVLIELETKFRRAINHIAENPKKFLNAIGKEQWIIQSGLIGQQHLMLFRKYFKNGIYVIPVKIENRDWNTAEKKHRSLLIGLRKKIRGKNCSSLRGICTPAKIRLFFKERDTFLSPSTLKTRRLPSKYVTEQVRRIIFGPFPFQIRA